ncbi:hypothetical protein T484DRAFT_1917152 [Baffinella frigidus]|nr:hypothetical protein T484DRAFT_1917152 [Cryptophyta sp. CCMP2293]|mmetsp:Transcript_65427/g.156073  ORF Transcript_65427/g.156073 Transcript_65427/m.156073 type:complete len:179 (+) Transcript_65427:25-561(+)
MVAVSYGTATGVTPVVEKRASMAPLKMAAGIMAGLMAAAMVAAMVTSQQESPAHFKSELLAYRKVVGQTQMLDSKDFAENADGEDVDDENTAGDGAYECCWHAPNAALASTSVASRVGPNGWGNKADADGSVDHYTNALGEVPDWVFKGTADHQWKDYDEVFNQEGFKNSYPTGEGGI